MRRSTTLLLLFGVLALIARVSAITKKEAEKDDEDDSIGEFLDLLGFVVDLVNLVAFVFAGGPEEVAARIVALVVAVLIATVFVCSSPIPQSQRPSVCVSPNSRLHRVCRMSVGVDPR